MVKELNAKDLLQQAITTRDKVKARLDKEDAKVSVKGDKKTLAVTAYTDAVTERDAVAAELGQKQRLVDALRALDSEQPEAKAAEPVAAGVPVEPRGTL